MSDRGALLLVLAALLAGCATEPLDRADSASVAPEDAAAPQPAGAPSEEVTESPPPGPITGESRLSSASVCLPVGPRGCLGHHEWDDGSFALATDVRAAVLTATWNASITSTGELAVSLLGATDTHASGPSPLELRVGDLHAGDYLVAVRMTAPGGVVNDQTITWMLTFDAAE